MTSLEKDISPEGNTGHLKHDIVKVSFYYDLTSNPEHSVSLPQANFSTSVRSHGSL